jgi:hypothetical protein
MEHWKNGKRSILTVCAAGILRLIFFINYINSHLLKESIRMPQGISDMGMN